MENHNNSNSFHYTYSAKQQDEIKSIRKKYVPQEEDKMTRLRRLDQSVTRKGTIISLIVGIAGALLLGLGMSCILVWGGRWFIPGILIGVIGLAVAVASYPIFINVTNKEREKIAPEILRLTDELMK